MKKLRLLVTKDCPKNCTGCCNKDWNLDELPIVEHFNYDEIILTGGEPFSVNAFRKTVDLLYFLKNIMPDDNRKVYVYTTDAWAVYDCLEIADGFTLTLHDQEDVDSFFIAANDALEQLLEQMPSVKCSLRLHIFKGITLPDDINLSHWQVKSDIEWIENCPLPVDEEFRRLKNI